MKTAKRILSLILAAALLCGTLTVGVSAADVVSAYEGSTAEYTVVPSQTEVAPGETFKVDFYIKANYYLGAFGGDAIFWTNNLTVSKQPTASAEWLKYYRLITNSNVTEAKYFPSGYTSANSTLYQIARVTASSGVSASTKLYSESPILMYSMEFTVPADATIGDTAVVSIPANLIRTASNASVSDYFVYQPVTTPTAAWTDAPVSQYAQNVTAQSVTIKIVPQADPCNYSALNAAKDDYSKIVESNYSASVWAASNIDSAWAAASAIESGLLDKGDNQQRIDTAATNLKNALAALSNGLKAELDAEIKAGTTYTEAQVTPSAWSSYTSALANAQSALADGSDSARANALSQLKNAKALLASGAYDLCDYADLKANISLYEKTYSPNKANYTPNSWKDAEEAYNAAIAIEDGLLDKDGNQDKIDTAAENLANALATLKAIASNRGELKTAIDTAPDKAENEVTAASWKKYIDAKTEAQKVYDDLNSTEAQVSKALSDLDLAKKGLIALVRCNYTALNNAVSAVGSKSAYTSASWAAVNMDALLNAAQELIDAELLADEFDANQDEINSLAASINDAATKLEKLGDKAKLTEALENAKTYNELDYTADSWTNSGIVNAIDEAQKVLDMAEPSEALVNGAIAEITASISHLVNAGACDYDALKAAVAAVADKTAYTSASWADVKMDELLANAQELISANLKNDPYGANQSEIDSLASSILDAKDRLVKIGDKAKLAAAITKALGYSDLDYTAESWTAAGLAIAIEEAQKVNAMAEPTEAQVDNAIAEINASIEQLVPAGACDYDALNAAIASVGEKSTYTSASWAAAKLDELLANAQELIDANLKNDPYGANQDEINSLASSINEAIALLEKLGSKTELTAAIEKAEGYSELDYTADSWTAAGLKNAIDEARAILALDEPTDAQVKNAIAEIDASISQLVVADPCDYSKLNEAVASVGDKSTYTDASWAAVKMDELLANAQELIDAELNKDPYGANQDEIDSLADSINDAVAKLEKLGNKTELSAALTKANACVSAKEDYTAESWIAAGLEIAIEEAQRVIADPQASEAEVASALAELESSMSHLEKRQDKTALVAAIAKVNEAIANEEKYTPSSFAAADLATVLANANKINDKDNASAAEIAEQVQAIDAALALLKIKADKADLKTAIDTLPAVAKEHAVEATWAEYEDKLAKANSVYNNADASQDEVDTAKNNLIVATENVTEKDADYSKLNTAIADGKAEVVKTTVYSATSLAKLQTAIDNAENVEKNLKISNQKKIDDLESAIRNAIRDLVTLGQCDYSKLNAAIDAYEKLQKDNYRPSVWASSGVEAAYAAAKAIDTGLSADEAGVNQKKIDDAAAALSNAIAALNEGLKPNKAELDAEIKAGTTYTAEAIPAEYWTAYQNALAKAKQVNDDVEATAQDVADALAALKAAKADLAANAYDLCDYTELDNAIAAYKDLDKEDYIAKYWNESDVESRYADANDIQRGLYNKDGNQAMIDSIATALKQAIASLAGCEVFDKSDLLAEINAGVDYTADEVKPEAWAAYTAALAKANAANSNPDTKKAEADKALEELKAAKANLAANAYGKCDYTELDKAIKAYEELNKNDYTPDSWTNSGVETCYNVAKSTPRDLLNKDNNQQGIDEAATNLKNAIEQLVPVATNFGELEAAINAEPKFNEAYATDDTWNTYKNAIAEGRELLANPNASQQAIAEAIEAINAANAALASRPVCDYAQLNAAVAAIGAKGTYTSASWSAVKMDELLNAAYELIDAQLINDKFGANQNEIASLAKSINDAAESLEKLGDKSKLTAAVTKANSYFEYYYTDESWAQASIEVAVEEANVLLAKAELSESEVANAIAEIEASISHLVLRDKCNYTALNEAIAKAENAITAKTDYTPNSWSAAGIEALLASAREIPTDLINDKFGANQGEIDSLVNSINDAVDGLVKCGNKAQLNTAIINAERDYQKSLYTEESWAVSGIEDAIKEAKALLDDANATQADVDGAIAEIEASAQRLQKLTGVNALQGVIDQADNLVKDNYTADSWTDSNIDEILEAAKNTLNSGSATDEEIKKATDDLTEAIGKLIEADADYSALNEALASVPSDLTIYDDEARAAVEDAVRKANAVPSDLKKANQKLIDDAALALSNAVAALEGSKKSADYTNADAAKAKAEEMLNEKAGEVFLYDDATRAALTEAIAKWNALDRNLKIDEQAKVNEVEDALNAAMAAPVKRDADTSKLVEAIASAQEEVKKTGVYSAAGLKAIKDAIDAANAVIAAGHKADNQATVDNAVTALQNAVASAEKAGADYTKLDKAIEDAKAKYNAKVGESYLYDEASRAALKSAIETAEAVDRNLLAGNQSVIDNAVKALNKVADEATKNPANYSALEDAIAAAKAEAAKSELYTEETISEINKAVAKAQEALDAGYALDEQGKVDAAYEALVNNDAVKNPEKKPADYTEADAAKAKAEEMLNAKVNGEFLYDEATREALADAIAKWNELDKNLKIDEQGKVDAVKDSLTAATSAPVKAPADYTEADAAKAKAEEMLNKKVGDAYLYDDATREALAEAIAKWNELDKNLKIDEQGKVDAVKDSLASASAAPVKRDADYSKLDEAIEALKNEIAKGETVYTPEGIAALEKALADAEKVKNDGLKIDEQDKVNAAVSAANSSMGSAEKSNADYTELDKAIEEAKAKYNAKIGDEFLYDDASREALKNAIATAEAVDRDLLAGDQSVIDAAVEALNGVANAATKKPADYSALTAAITAAKAMAEQTDVYTAETIAEINKAIAEAEKAVNANYTLDEQTKVNSAYNALVNNDAIKNPVKKGDYTELDKVIAELKAEIAKTSLYTESGKKTLEDALVMAQAVKDAAYTAKDQNKIDTAVNNVKDALSRAEKNLADTSKLESTLENAKNEILGEYTQESREELKDVIDMIEDFIKEPIASDRQDEVDAKLDALKDALANLKRYYNRVNLSIQKPSKNKFMYQMGIILHATIGGEYPEGAHVVWTQDNNNFKTTDRGDTSCSCSGELQIVSDLHGSTTFTATVVDAEGNPVLNSNGQAYTQSVTIKSQANWFYKIIAAIVRFFRSLFGQAIILPQAMGFEVK